MPETRPAGPGVRTEFDPRGILPPGADGRYGLPFGDSHPPVPYSLRAVSPDSA
ncbi:hypothetical protein [Streptomyces sp. NPDC090036]|uniref:hypothetical protein n=1 Tax=Streptomyces sp. NPDC090036 TaxID=3365926 RepID=UPI00380F2ED5